MKSELTPRQWALYRFLKKRGDRWTYQTEVAKIICSQSNGEYYSDWNGKPKDFHDSAARLQMTKDIRAINDSNVIQKIIISSPRGIKIANKSEFKKYIRKEIGAAVRRLMRAKRKAEKASRDGQSRITFGAYERDVIKSFIE